MTAAPGSLMLRAMGADPRRFMVEVDAASNPIAGKVYLTAAELPFVGWLGLATALEQVLEEGGGRAVDGQSMDPTERTER